METGGADDHAKISAQQQKVENASRFATDCQSCLRMLNLDVINHYQFDSLIVPHSARPDFGVSVLGNAGFQPIIDTKKNDPGFLVGKSVIGKPQ